MSRAVKRLLAFAAGTLAALLLLAVALWWAAAPSLAKGAIDAALRRASLPAFAYRIGALSWGTLQLHEIHLDSGELAAQRVELRWSWSDLRARRLDSAAVFGLSVAVRRGERGWSLGALDPWLADLVASRSATPTVPLRQLAVRGAALSIDTPAGPVRAVVDADLTLQPLLSGSVGLAWQLPDATPGSARLQIDEAGAIGARLQLALERALVARWDPALAQRWPHRLELSVDGKGARSADEIDLELALDAQLADGQRPQRIRRAAGPLRMRWQPDALLVSLLPCVTLTLPDGPVAPGFALERGTSLCVHTEEEAPIRVSLADPVVGRIDARIVARAEDLSLRFGARERPRRLRGHGVALHLSTDPAAPRSRGTLRLSGASIALPDAGLALRGALVEGDWSLATGASLEGRFRVGQLRDGGSGSRFPPLQGEGRFAFDPRRLRFDARARDETGALRARIRGRHAPSSGVGDAQVSFEPLVFGEPQATLRVLERWLGRQLRIEDGSIGVEARLRWGEAGLAAAADLSIDDAVLVASGHRIEGIAGEVALAELRPLATAGLQELRFRRGDAGVPVGAGRIRYAIEPARVIRIEPAEIDFAGGRLEVRGALDLKGGPDQRLEFRLLKLQAPELLALAPVEGLEVSGQLSGELVLSVEEGRPVLRGAGIRATDGGRIRYRPEGAGVAPAAGPDDVSGVLRDVLRDFRYEELTVSVAGWLDERADVQARLRGYNPSFQGGRPVHLTLNLSTAFAEVIHAIPALESYFARLAARPGAQTRELSTPTP